MGAGLQCCAGKVVCGCFWNGPAQRGRVSLNRSEQMLFDYWEANPDERQFWRDKVQTAVRAAVDEHAAAFRLEADLWAYFVERSGVVAPFREVAGREGLTRTSMRNLADYLIRLWTEPRPKPKRARPVW